MLLSASPATPIWPVCCGFRAHCGQNCAWARPVMRAMMPPNRINGNTYPISNLPLAGKLAANCPSYFTARRPTSDAMFDHVAFFGFASAESLGVRGNTAWRSEPDIFVMPSSGTVLLERRVSRKYSYLPGSRLIMLVGKDQLTKPPSRFTSMCQSQHTFPERAG